MIEHIIEKIMPYKVIIVPADCYEHESDGKRDIIGGFFGFEKRFITKCGFNKFIKRVEDPNDMSSCPRRILRPSSMIDDKTYIAIPDTMPDVPGEYSIEIPEEFKKYFEQFQKS